MKYLLKKLFVKTFLRAAWYRASATSLPNDGISNIAGSHTIVLNNTTDKTKACEFLGPNKLIYYGMSARYGLPEGIDIYNADSGTGIESYAKFMHDIVAKAKPILSMRIVAHSQNKMHAISQVQSTTITINSVSRKGQHISSHILPFKYVNGTHFNPDIIDIPISFRMDADTYISMNIWPQTQFTILFFEHECQRNIINNVWCHFVKRMATKRQWLLGVLFKRPKLDFVNE